MGLDLWLLGSLAALAYWAVTTRLGWKKLKVRPVRENVLQLPTLLFVFACFLAVNAGVVTAFRAVGLIHPTQVAATGPELADVRNSFWGLVAQSGAELAIVALVLPLAASAFAGGLRGFGLTGRQIVRQVAAGLGYFIVVFPAVMMVLAGTQKLFEWCRWPLTEHGLLQIVRRTDDIRLVLAGSAMAAVAAPIGEEVFFRGLVQSFLVRFFRVMMPPKGWPMMAFWIKPPELRRSEAEAVVARARAAGEMPPMELEAPPAPETAGGQAEPLSPAQEGRRALAAVVASAAVFAAVHYSVPESVPAIFLLALALGYAYEKTGSLVTCITMHMAFNGLNLVNFLLRVVRQAPPA